MSLVLIDGNKQVLSVSSYSNLISKKDKSFSFLNDRNNRGNHSITLDDEQIAFNNLSIVKINVSCAGIITFYIKIETFNESLIDNVKTLKDIDSSTYESAVDKISKLLNIVFKSGFVFATFQPYDSGYDVKELLFSSFDDNKKYLLFIKETCINKSVNNYSIKRMLVDNKLRWWLMAVSGLISGCILPFGILKIYQNNIGLVVFLFITVLAGLVALYISHNDVFRKNQSINIKELVLCLSFDLISVILGYALFIGIYFLSKKDENSPTLLIISLISIGFIILLYLLVIGICYLVNRGKNKNR